MPSIAEERVGETLCDPATIPAGREVVWPGDVHNRSLVDHAHPPDWINPDPPPRYNLVVVGGGTAGLVTAAGAAGLGARVALVERHLLGGDCLNYGCVPSKALLRAARAYADVRDAGDYGVRVPEGVRVDFGAVMERMRRLRAGIADHDSAARFRDLGVDVFLGDGRFSGPDSLTVAGKSLRFKKACIATGARAAVLPIPGLEDVGYLTNETVFSLTDLPERLAVIGAGPIGCELSQAFARFGSRVFLIEAGDHILSREDGDAAERIQKALRRDGVELITSAEIQSIEEGGGHKIIRFLRNRADVSIPVNEILVGVGRVPNVEGMGLEEVGVSYDRRKGVEVNDHLQTTNPKIFAAGDVCSATKFTHTADAMARIVIQNALFMGRARASKLTVPWCTYTDPEIAHVGLYEKEAEARGLKVETFTEELAEVERAVLDGEAEGFIKVHVEAGGDRILGATVVARHAGEMLGEITLAMVGGLGLKTISKTIHPYPTQAEAIKRMGDAYMRTKLTPKVKKLFRKWLSWTR